jgi:phosphatidyl-myo-inositol dimannoside synthase
VKALLVSNDFLPQVGGIQQYTDNIARRLEGGAAFAASHPQAAASDASLPYPVYRGASRYMLPSRRTAAAIGQATAAEGTDVILFMAPWPLPALGPRIGLPWAAVCHGAELVMASRAPGPKQLLARWLRRAGCIFAVSAYTGRHARALVGPDGPPIRLLRTGVPLDVFRPLIDGSPIRQRHELGDGPVVVCVGRLVARKGQDNLVRAMPAVRRRVPGAQLLLVGDGPLRRRLERMAAEREPGSVVLAGQVPWAELPLYHAAGDVFACPNRSRWGGWEQEGFGVIFLEAQACGRPVVAGRSGGAPEALVERETGLLVDGSSTSDIVEALVWLLEDRERARRMGDAGRRFVEECFDWDDIVGRLAADLEVLAAGKDLESEL